jgi:hypothetical protein
MQKIIFNFLNTICNEYFIDFPQIPPINADFFINVCENQRNPSLRLAGAGDLHF